MPSPPFRHRFEGRPSYPRVVLVTVLFGLFTVGFTITILAVSIPQIASDLHADTLTLGWVITGPLLAVGVVGPSVGKLGDLYGHRRAYLVGLTFEAVFAALTALAWSAGSLIAFRILGAATGAIAAPASLAMINRVYAPDQRARAMGYWSLVGAGGPVIGVVAGGPLVDTFGFRVIFLAQVPLILLAVASAWALLPDIPGRPARFDVAGTVLLALATGPVLFALNRGPVLGWGSPVVVAGFLLLPVALAAFVVVERRAVEPLFPLRYFRRRNVTFPLLVQALSNFAYMGGFFLTPLLLEEQLHFSASKTGLVSIARPLTFAVVGPVAGAWAVRTGERTMAMLGSLAVGASMVWLSAVGLSTPVVMISGALALSGVGLGLSSPAMAASLANAVDEVDLGVAAATSQLVTQVGVVAGQQLMLSVQTARAPAVGEVPAYGEAYLLAAGVCVLSVVAGAFVRNSRGRGRHRADDADLLVYESATPEVAPAGSPTVEAV